MKMPKVIADNPKFREAWNTIEGMNNEQREAFEKEQKRIIDEEIRQIEKERDNIRRKNRLIQTGVKPLHANCTFDNYICTNPKQAAALETCKNYVKDFGFGGFVFSGKSGTGKNHLAAAICIELASQNREVLLITLNAMMRKFKDSMTNPNITESMLIKDFVKLDLLVIDEIGLQKLSEYTAQILNEIIDTRQLELRPTGIITNLNSKALEENVGVRVMDRLAHDGLWLRFDWESHRRNKKLNNK